MEIGKIDSLDLSKVHKILTSGNITDGQKLQFIKNNQAEIHSIVSTKLTSADFGYIMKNRPLIKFRPIKNSYTKRGDKILLAKTLGINVNGVDGYIESTSLKLNSLEASSLSYISQNDLEATRTYVYRHGTKEQVINFLDNELFCAKDILDTLYKTLSYETGGVADYFIRPIHKMDNRTLISIFNVVDKNLERAQKSGQIDAQRHDETARWALVRIYEIQNNQKLRNALKVYNRLT